MERVAAKVESALFVFLDVPVFIDTLGLALRFGLRLRERDAVADLDALGNEEDVAT
jgi:hypothetical protein